ncbi:MAG: transcriptional regulator [Gammaproteobacteria bacterium]|nr:transcriptional regulator [Gammaproteobacteria bacterium]MCH9744793.1 transcriptional regulator [Gammaproteobacteria bacterium]
MDWHIESLKNKKKALVYLQVALDDYQEDGDTEALLIAFRDVAKAQGGIAKLAEKAQLHPKTLYRTLSSKGNPKLSTLGKLLSGLGFHLVIAEAR